MSIQCSRCSSTAEPLPQPPLPTPVGREIQVHVCPACWNEWLGVQVMLINEYRLNLIDPQARAELERQMRTFLNLVARPQP
jgi:Fe-S cluster biosynthesis and repair protein YggX